MKSESQKIKINYISFNQDNTCFVVGTSTDFRVYRVDPLKCYKIRAIPEGINRIEMLQRTNILAFQTENYIKNNQLYLWDDKEQKIFKTIIVKEPILNFKIKRKLIFIVCQDEIKIICVIGAEIDMIKTIKNKEGIFSISQDINSNIIAYLSGERKDITIKNYNNFESGKIKEKIISNAHDYEIMMLTLNNVGTLIASINIYGKVFKVFNAETGDLIFKFRRGQYEASIYSMAFDFKSKYFACSSNHETIHIFKLKNEKKNFLGKIYQSSENLSFCKFKKELFEICFVGFSNENSNNIFAVSKNGIIYNGKFDPNNDVDSKNFEQKNNFIELKESIKSDDEEEEDNEEDDDNNKDE
jgi:WD40 repeat protein